MGHCSLSVCVQLDKTRLPWFEVVPMGQACSLAMQRQTAELENQHLKDPTFHFLHGLGTSVGFGRNKTPAVQSRSSMFAADVVPCCVKNWNLQIMDIEGLYTFKSKQRKEHFQITVSETWI